MKGTLAFAFIAILCLSMFSAFAPKVNAQQSSADWPMFRADPSHSGAGTGNPVLVPTLLWKSIIANSATGGLVDSSPAVVNGVVYIGSAVGAVPAEQSTSASITAGAVYALNATNGAKLWNYTIGGLGFESSPAVVGGIVYIGSDDGNVYALNATSGDKLWKYTTGGGESSPAVVNGVVYVGGGNNVIALSASPASPSTKSFNTLSIVIGGIVAIVIVAVVFLMFKKRSKTKPTSPPPTP